MIPKCKNCLLFDKENGLCRTQIVFEGEIHKIPVKPEDECHWIRIDLEVQQEIREAIRTAPDNPVAQKIKKELIEELDKPVAIKEMKFWSDGKDGHFQER